MGRSNTLPIGRSHDPEKGRVKPSTRSATTTFEEPAHSSKYHIHLPHVHIPFTAPASATPLAPTSPYALQKESQGATTPLPRYLERGGLHQTKTLCAQTKRNAAALRVYWMCERVEQGERERSVWSRGECVWCRVRLLLRACGHTRF